MRMTLNQLAYRDFERAAQQAFWRDLISRWSRKDNQLLSFEQVLRTLPFSGQHNRGLQAVPIDEIMGSVGRYRDFDRAFFPRHSHTRERWVSIDKAHYEQVSLPPVKLFKIGQIYFVGDGHHRVSVARAHGQLFIDAYITEFDAPAPAEPSN